MIYVSPIQIIKSFDSTTIKAECLKQPLPWFVYEIEHSLS